MIKFLLTTKQLRRKHGVTTPGIDLIVSHAPLWSYFIYVLGIILIVALLGIIAGCTQSTRDQMSGHLGGEISITKKSPSIEEIIVTPLPD